MTIHVIIDISQKNVTLEPSYCTKLGFILINNIISFEFMKRKLKRMGIANYNAYEIVNHLPESHVTHIAGEII
jgi:hypothetical protein